MKSRMMKRFGAVCIGLAGILAACQPAQTSGPVAETPKTEVVKTDAGPLKGDTTGKAATDVPVNLNDPCFPGRGAPLPASCPGVVPDPVAVPDPKTVTVGPVVTVPVDVPVTLDDPCFPGRGAPLPASCGGGVTDPVTVSDPKAVPVDTAGKVSTDGGQTLNDPCFQGRGGPLPSYCGT